MKILVINKDSLVTDQVVIRYFTADREQCEYNGSV